MNKPTQPYEKWLIEKVDALGRLPPELVSDDEVEDFIDKLTDSGMDCYINKVTIH